MLSRSARTSCSTSLPCSGLCGGPYSLWHARRTDSRKISSRQRLTRAPFLRVAALFDEEDPEGELFAPYWGQQEVDWENPPEENNGLGQVWYEGDASPEDLAQNALAVALSALLVWGVGSILWKLLVVSYALFAAAFRYSFVALVLLVVVVFLAS